MDLTKIELEVITLDLFKELHREWHEDESTLKNDQCVLITVREYWKDFESLLHDIKDCDDVTRVRVYSFNQNSQGFIWKPYVKEDLTSNRIYTLGKVISKSPNALQTVCATIKYKNNPRKTTIHFTKLADYIIPFRMKIDRIHMDLFYNVNSKEYKKSTVHAIANKTELERVLT